MILGVNGVGRASTGTVCAGTGCSLASVLLTDCVCVRVVVGSTPRGESHSSTEQNTCSPISQRHGAVSTQTERRLRGGSRSEEEEGDGMSVFGER